MLAATYPKATFTQLACTGATFDKGISGPWSASPGRPSSATGTPYRPQPSVYSRRSQPRAGHLGGRRLKLVDIVTQCAEYVYYHPFSDVQCTAAQPNGPRRRRQARLHRLHPHPGKDLRLLPVDRGARDAAWVQRPSTQDRVHHLREPSPNECPGRGEELLPGHLAALQRPADLLFFIR